MIEKLIERLGHFGAYDLFKAGTTSNYFKLKSYDKIFNLLDLMQHTYIIYTVVHIVAFTCHPFY